MPRDTKTQDSVGAGMRETLAAKKHHQVCGFLADLMAPFDSRQVSPLFISTRASRGQTLEIG